MEYVIVYTNDRIVQRHRVYCLVSKHISTRECSKGSPTSPMQVSTDESITQSLESLVMNVIHMGNCW